MKKKLKTVHLSSGHKKLDIRVFNKECCTLAAAGYDVVLVSPVEQKGMLDGVRLRSLPVHKNRYQRFLVTIWQVFFAALDEKAGIYHFHDPALIPFAVLLKWITRKRVIYDAHEDVPRDVMSKEWIPFALRKPIAGIVNVIEQMGTHVFDGVIAATPSIAKKFPRSKTVLVQNYPYLSELKSTAGLPYQERQPNLVYVGAISVARGINEVVEALARLPETLPAKLTLAGRFSPESLETDLQRMPGWARACFLGWLSRPETLNLLAEARAGIVTLLPEPNYIEAQPNKLFEYMAAGLPVIASNFQAWRSIIDGIGCGIQVDPESPDEIARAIQWIMEHPAESEAMGMRGRAAIEQQFNWEATSKNLLEFYRRLAQ